MSKEEDEDTKYCREFHEIHEVYEPWTRSSIIRTIRLNAKYGRSHSNCVCLSMLPAAKRLFGSLEVACRAAGVEPPEPRRREGRRVR